MLNKLENELKIRGFSKKTVDAYLHHNKNFLNFIKKEPGLIEENDAKRYIAYLIADRKLKPKSINLMLSSLKFFYKEIIQNQAFNAVKAQKADKKIPTVLTKE